MCAAGASDSLDRCESGFNGAGDPALDGTLGSSGTLGEGCIAAGNIWDPCLGVDTGFAHHGVDTGVPDLGEIAGDAAGEAAAESSPRSALDIAIPE